MAIISPNCPEVLAVVLGAARSGVVPVMVNPSLLAGERDLILADADCRAILGPLELVEAVASDRRVPELASVPVTRPMHYTSGTSGHPKGVWCGLLDDAEAAALNDEEVDLWGFDRSDRHVCCAPLHHSAPLRFASMTLLAGGEVCLLPGFVSTGFEEAIVRSAPTTAFLAPVHLRRFLASGRPPDLTSFRLVAHAGAPCPPSVKRRALAAFPAGVVWEFYGSTEGQFTACGPEEWMNRPGTVGRARPRRRLAVDPDGVIWCEVPPYARWSYWRDAGRTAVAWRGASFSVFDIGRVDASGYLFLDGRRDDLIISGGVNVYPLEVELVLSDVSGVDEVIVFGAPDPDWGQRVCAAFDGSASPEALARHAATHLAPYKRPTTIYHISADTVPRTPSGKVRRSLVADGLQEQSGWKRER